MEREQRRFIDMPYVLEILDLEQTSETERKHAEDKTSGLPVRHRNILARGIHNKRRILRELRNTPDKVAEERARDATAPPVDYVREALEGRNEELL